MSEVHQGAGSEPSPEAVVNTNISRYISQRCEQDAVYKASGFARSLSADQRPTYVDQMQKTTREIIDVLQIDDELFTDKKHCEAFFAACDSWLVNETNKDNPNYEVEKTFLNQFIRILAGDKSQYNITAAKQQEENSGYYVMPEEGTIEKSKDRKEFQELKDHENSEKSLKLLKSLNSWEEDSLLQSVRENLGITAREHETPFRVMVVEASKEKPWNNELKDRDLSEWELLTDQKTDALTTYDPEDEMPIIVLHDQDFKALIGEEEDEKERSLGRLGHEYAHTQWQMRIGAHTALGRFWDERMAIYASKGTGHWDTTITFQMMDLVLSTETDEIPLWDAFDRGIKSDSAIAEFYKYVSDNFGLRSTLFLLAVMPGNYIEPYGIDTIPEIRLDSTYRADDLLKAILEEREKIEPGSKDHLVENLKSVKQSFIQGLILVSGIEAHMQLPDYIRQVLKDRNEDKGLGNILV